LRDRLALRTPKDGCSPQGQCGCCTIWVDGNPRVSCVTPVRRVDGRSVTTLEGIDPELRSVWGEAFSDTGASQCGFCTPGIIMRLAALAEKKPGASTDEVAVSLAAHLCRCTGWRTIFDAFDLAKVRLLSGAPEPPRDLGRAAERARIEGHCPQLVGPDVACGLGGFADDTSPVDALVAVPDGAGDWSVAETLTEARKLAGKVQGRNSGLPVSWPVDVPDGEWALRLQTTFVEPAYLEPDASWCEPGGEPASPVANGGAFGGKRRSIAPAAARELADRHNRAVRVLLSREDVVRSGPKRPPIAAGIRLDGSGAVRIARTTGSPDLMDWVNSFASVAPNTEIEVVEATGPPVSSDARAAGWAEAAILMAALDAFRAGTVGRDPCTAEVRSPDGGHAKVTVEDRNFRVVVDGGEILDEVVLRSYCIGAVHQALGWVSREAIAVGASGEVLDLTIRSFGIIPARETPAIEVEIVDSQGPSVNASDAVFAATAAAIWITGGLGPRWPIMAG
jgi:xanthine dehydrogenase small subunit